MLASIDIGNSQVKIGFFKEDKPPKAENVETSSILKYLQENKGINLIISSVTEDNSAISELVIDFQNLLELKSDTPVPLNIDYETPNSLGIDRVPAVVGAIYHFQGPLDFVDAGSCIICDLIMRKIYSEGVPSV